MTMRLLRAALADSIACQVDLAIVVVSPGQFGQGMRWRSYGPTGLFRSQRLGVLFGKCRAAKQPEDGKVSPGINLMGLFLQQQAVCGFGMALIPAVAYMQTITVKFYYVNCNTGGSV